MMRNRQLLIGLLVPMALSSLGWAQNPDPPSRVARLSLLDGPVSYRPAGADDWGDGSLNYPLTTGDSLWADQGARAELQIGSAAVRLSSGTALQVTNLSDQAAQFNITEGTINVHLRDLGTDELFEVDTPNGAISILRPGNYRIDTYPDGRGTVVSVRDGQVEVTGGGQAVTVRPHEAARLNGTDEMSYDLVAMAPPDDWDRWCFDRDRYEDRVLTDRHIPRGMIGGSDLVQYGGWRDVPDYGSIWVPRGVEAGWAPYRYGHWAWVEPWGWTWVDNAPWGFAPFHYGRWVNYEGTWGWVPGPPAVRPVYAPALVAFVGGGGGRGGFSIGVGVGAGIGVGVAWFPLGPREIYRPAYHVSPTYVNRVNVTNVTNITNINVTNVNVNNTRYVNQTIATTAMPQNAFAGAQNTRQSFVAVPAQQAAQARVIGSAPQVAPMQQSLVGPRVSSVRPPAQAFSRQVIARTAPPPAAVPFAQRQQYLSANPGRPVDPGTLNQIRQNAPQVRQQVPQVRVLTPQGQPNGAGGQRFGLAPQNQPNGNFPAGNVRPQVNPQQGNSPNGGFPGNQRPQRQDQPIARPNMPVQPPPQQEQQARPQPQDRPFARPNQPVQPPPQQEQQARPQPQDRPFARPNTPVQPPQQQEQQARPQPQDRPIPRPQEARPQVDRPVPAPARPEREARPQRPAKEDRPAKEEHKDKEKDK